MAAAVEKELHELGNGIYAYTQLPGSWGWSNAGLITDGDQSLLVDTLFDEKITAEMLASMRRATRDARIRLMCRVRLQASRHPLAVGRRLDQDARR
jgi:hypothetical protein